MEAFKKLRSSAVLVFYDTENKQSPHENLSPITAGGLLRKSMGNYIPKVVVTTPDQNTYLGSLSYQQLKEPKNFRKIKKQIKEGLAGSPPPLPEDFKYRPYSHLTKYFLRCDRIERINEKRFRIHLDDKYYTKDITELGKAAHAWLEHNHPVSGNSQAPSTRASALTEEQWVNTKGKIISATFVSLLDGRITLRKTNGKNVTFPLDLLNEESQNRAQQHAGR